MESVGWSVLLAALGRGGAALLLVIVTDGRYGGRGLIRWVYGRLGPGIFGARRERMA